jgi:hypothetical protein
MLSVAFRFGVRPCSVLAARDEDMCRKRVGLPTHFRESVLGLSDSRAEMPKNIRIVTGALSRSIQTAATPTPKMIFPTWMSKNPGPPLQTTLDPTSDII